MEEPRFPINPLVQAIVDQAIQQRTIADILESYNSNYDVLSELIQNSVDAVEDAYLQNFPGPFSITVHVNLQDNWVSVLDTGVGMSRTQAVAAFAPHISFKNNNQLLINKRGKKAYRGYKGVGLTFIAYGTDDITLHTKAADGALIKGRMQYARTWANGDRNDPALIVEDNSSSPLDSQSRGTFVKIQLSPKTRPKKLSGISPYPDAWKIILKTRTAIGQIALFDSPLVDIQVKLVVIDTNGTTQEMPVESCFLLPHLVDRRPEFRFLDVPNYYTKHKERSDIPADFRRQDGLYLIWDKNRIFDELTDKQREKFKDEIDSYNPTLYAFFPYQTIIWNQINESLSGGENRRYITPGLIIGVNRQRLADQVNFKPTRYANLAPTLFVLVHFENAKPDQGRKTVQDEVVEFAKTAADRVLQYCVNQKEFLKPRGDSPTPGQREVELNHDEWKFNVQDHARNKPLDIPPVTYKSMPLTEQDVTGLFHQLSALGIFPGIQVFATSQIKTYDSLIKYECSVNTKGLRYQAADNDPLGVSPYILGKHDTFSTRYLTLEFKNNLDLLVGEFGDGTDADSRKDFKHIDICVCWGVIADFFPGYVFEEITKQNIDERKYPGITHLLRRDGDSHVVQVILLEKVVEMITTGRILIG